MKINETIKHLQSQIKLRSLEIASWEKERASWKASAKHRTEANDEWAFTDWKRYHDCKDIIRTLAKQQKIEKNLYKYLLEIRKAVGFLVD